jgi:hypothetical protein
MNMLRKTSPLLHWSGLLVASVLWMINTQLGQILPYLDCQHQARDSAVAACVAGGVSCLAGAISWRSIGHVDGREPPRTWRFVGSISMLAALVLAFALSMQGMAGLVLDGCER